MSAVYNIIPKNLSKHLRTLGDMILSAQCIFDTCSIYNVSTVYLQWIDARGPGPNFQTREKIHPTMSYTPPADSSVFESHTVSIEVRSRPLSFTTEIRCTNAYMMCDKVEI